MGILKQFATNRKLEVTGVPVKFDPNPDGTVPTIYVKRTFRESPAYQAVFERVTRPFKDVINDKERTLDEATDNRLMQRVCAEACVTGWLNMRLPEGVAGIGKGEGLALNDPYDPAKGAPMSAEDARRVNGEQFDIEFSVDACVRIFDMLPDMWRTVAATAGNADAYKVGELEDMVKNS